MSNIRCFVCGTLRNEIVDIENSFSENEKVESNNLGEISKEVTIHIECELCEDVTEKRKIEYETKHGSCHNCKCRISKVKEVHPIEEIKTECAVCGRERNFEYKGVKEIE